MRSEIPVSSIPIKEEMKLHVLLMMYEETMLQRRHHETFRATLSGCLVTIYIALISFTLKSNVLLLRPTCFFISFLSLFGFICTLSYSQRYIFYWRRSQVIRNYIDLYITNGTIEKLHAKAINYRSKISDEKKWPHRFPKWLSHHFLWIYLHLIIFITTLIAGVCL